MGRFTDRFLKDEEPQVVPAAKPVRPTAPKPQPLPKPEVKEVEEEESEEE